MGWCRLIGKGMLLEILGNYLDTLPKLIAKPLGRCIPCSASFVGTVGYILLILGGHATYSLPIHFVYMIACVNLNSLIWFITEFFIIFTITKRNSYGKTDSIQTDNDIKT